MYNLKEQIDMAKEDNKIEPKDINIEKLEEMLKVE